MTPSSAWTVKPTRVRERARHSCARDGRTDERARAVDASKERCARAVDASCAW